MIKREEAAELTAAEQQEHPKDDVIPPISALEEDILTLLLGQPLYGLQICKAIDEASEGKQTLKIGSLYPSLHRLESKGLVFSYMQDEDANTRKGNRRKYYRITGKGSRALNQKQMTRINLAKWRPSPA